MFFEIEFYKIIIYMLFIIFKVEAFSIKGLIVNTIPIYSVTTNFFDCYLLFFLCIPFLNILVNNMNEKMHIILLALLLFIYSVLGTIPHIYVSMNYVTWFSVIYMLASYIRCYQKKIFENKKIWNIAFILSIIGTIISILICYKIDVIKSYYFVADSNKITAVMVSLCFFMFFKNLKITYNKFINIIAKATFGVLSIHANSDIMRRWLWKDVLHNVSMMDSNFIILHSILSVIGVYAVCVIIDLIRIKLLEEPFFKHLDKYSSKIKNKFKNYV